jgi:hypothetical protein
MKPATLRRSAQLRQNRFALLLFDPLVHFQFIVDGVAWGIISTGG